MSSKLSTTSHSSDSIGMKYIYPVISRRTGGLSIGVNFNTDNSCNWRCIYCQVPNLKIGAAPQIDLKLLEDELRLFLDQVLNGDFYDRFGVDEDKRTIKDIAIAGNGEPTSLKKFAAAVTLIGSIATEFRVFPDSRYILITNGSLIHQPRVQEGLMRLNEMGGEVWFKLDSGTTEGRRFINNSTQSQTSVMKNLKLSAMLCTTKIQTCLFDYNKKGLSLKEKNDLLLMFKAIKADIAIKHIMLYTIARPSLQPESHLLEKLPVETMNRFADEIRALDYEVSVSA